MAVYVKSEVGGTPSDVNADGKADLIWRNLSNGKVAVWLMDGTTIQSAGIPGGAPLVWQIVDVQDTNGDGKADLIWRHDDGRVAVWLMDGTALKSAGIPGAAPLVWEIQP